MKVAASNESGSQPKSVVGCLTMSTSTCPAGLSSCLRPRLRAGLPVIMNTAHDDDTRRKALEGGADALLWANAQVLVAPGSSPCPATCSS